MKFDCKLIVLVFLCSIICSTVSLRVFLIDKDDSGKPSLYSIQLIDPDDSASEQKKTKLFTSSTFSEVAPGIAYNFERNKVFFQGRLSVIPDDRYRSLKMSVDGKNLRSINSICDADLTVIASAQDYTYTVDSNLTLWQGGIDNSTEMMELFSLGTPAPTFMKFYNGSLYYTTGGGLYRIEFDNSTGEFIPLDEKPKLIFTPPGVMNQFDFDPKKTGILYYASSNKIMSLNLTHPEPTAVALDIKNLRAPVGVAVSKEPYYLLYTDTDALYQYDMTEKSVTELEVFTHTYGIAVSPAPSIFFLSGGMFYFFFFLHLFFMNF